MTNIPQDVTYILVQSPPKTFCGQKNAKSTTTPTLISSTATIQKKSSMYSPPSSKK